MRSDVQDPSGRKLEVKNQIKQTIYNINDLIHTLICRFPKAFGNKTNSRVFGLFAQLTCNSFALLGFRSIRLHSFAFFGEHKTVDPRSQASALGTKPVHSPCAFEVTGRLCIHDCALKQTIDDAFE